MNGKIKKQTNMFLKQNIRKTLGVKGLRIYISTVDFFNFKYFFLPCSASKLNIHFPLRNPVRPQNIKTGKPFVFFTFQSTTI